MRFRNPAADRETETRPWTLAATPGGIRPPKTIEDVGEVSGGDPNPRIRYLDHDGLRGLHARDRNLATLGRILDGVGDEVEKQLPRSRTVEGEHQGPVRILHRDAHRSQLAQDIGRLAHLRQQLAQVRRLEMQGGPSLVYPRQGEQGINDLRHAVHFHQRFLEHCHLVW